MLTFLRTSLGLVLFLLCIPTAFSQSSTPFPDNVTIRNNPFLRYEPDQIDLFARLVGFVLSDDYIAAVDNVLGWQLTEMQRQEFLERMQAVPITIIGKTEKPGEDYISGTIKLGRSPQRVQIAISVDSVPSPGVAIKVLVHEMFHVVQAVDQDEQDLSALPLIFVEALTEIYTQQMRTTLQDQFKLRSWTASYTIDRCSVAILWRLLDAAGVEAAVIMRDMYLSGSVEELENAVREQLGAEILDFIFEPQWNKHVGSAQAGRLLFSLIVKIIDLAESDQLEASWVCHALTTVPPLRQSAFGTKPFVEPDVFLRKTRANLYSDAVKADARSAKQVLEPFLAKHCVDRTGGR